MSLSTGRETGSSSLAHGDVVDPSSVISAAARRNATRSDGPSSRSRFVEIIHVVHTSDPFNFVNARRRSERTVLAGRPNSDAMSPRPRSS